MILFCVIFAVALEDAEFTRENNGIFGFVNLDNLFECWFLFGFMTGFMSSAGYIIATQYFSNMVVMNCFLIEPIISQIIGVLIEIDLIPGPMTWIGVSLIAIALNII